MSPRGEREASREDRGSRVFRGLAAIVVLTTAAPAGSAGSDDWRSEADARIETMRKRDVEIVVADRNGAPVAGAAVTANQTRHHFAFGSCINSNALHNASYADFFQRHFEWAVFENESKWFFNEPNRDFETYEQADGLIEFCLSRGIRVRGHCIFWAKEEYTPAWCRSLPEDELRGEVEERLDSAVSHFRGQFLHWDVNNEMLDGDFFRRRLGAEIEPHMFIRAHAIDPAALLFVNDYSTVECCPSRTQAYIAQVRRLWEAGAPVQAVGVQGHYWGPSVDPVATLRGLDDLTVLGLPIWITEYDCVNPDENARADALENLYRAAFSHPSVQGILMWGFWAGSHWRGADAAIVNLDWTLNEAGRRYEALLAEWTTLASGVTAPGGSFGFRGFHGTYDVSATAGGTGADEVFEVPPGDGPAAYLVPLKPGSCFAAREVRHLRVSRGGDGSRLDWDMAPWRNDFGTQYDVIRSTDPADFTAGTWIEIDGADTAALDPADPVPGTAFHYLVRAGYDCARGEGPFGTQSDGTPRAVP